MKIKELNGKFGLEDESKNDLLIPEHDFIEIHNDFIITYKDNDCRLRHVKTLVDVFDRGFRNISVHKSYIQLSLKIEHKIVDRKTLKKVADHVFFVKEDTNNNELILHRRYDILVFNLDTLEFKRKEVPIV